MKKRILEVFNILTKTIEQQIKENKLSEKFKFSSSIIPIKEWKYTSKEEERWFLWLCLVQNWLRNSYQININIGHRPHSQKYYFNITGKYDSKKMYLVDHNLIKYNSYLKALEKGVYEGLLLIV